MWQKEERACCTREESDYATERHAEALKQRFVVVCSRCLFPLACFRACCRSNDLAAAEIRERPKSAAGGSGAGAGAGAAADDSLLRPPSASAAASRGGWLLNDDRSASCVL